MHNQVPPPPSGSDGSPPSWADNTKAIQEDRNWNIEEKLKGQEGQNQLWVLKVLGWIVPSMMCIFFLIFASSLIVWVIHYLIPADCAWLSPEQLSKIQSVIFSGTLGAVVSSYANNKLN